MRCVRVRFENVDRALPIVLTQHQVATLAAWAGRDVRAELETMSAEHFPVSSLTKLMRVLRDRLTTPPVL